MRPKDIKISKICSHAGSLSVCLSVSVSVSVSVCLCLCTVCWSAYSGGMASAAAIVVQTLRIVMEFADGGDLKVQKAAPPHISLLTSAPPPSSPPHISPSSSHQPPYSSPSSSHQCSLQHVAFHCVPAPCCASTLTECLCLSLCASHSITVWLCVSCAHSITVWLCGCVRLTVWLCALDAEA